jgi:polyphosphate kinase
MTMLLRPVCSNHEASGRLPELLPFPIYDPAIRQQVQEIIDLQLADNTKARVLLPDNTSVINRNGQPPLRAQEALYEAACRVAQG